MLRAQLDEAICGDPYLDWSTQTLITATTLSNIFLETTIEECKATLAHLTVEQQHQSSHDRIEETVATPQTKLKSKLDSIPSPTASIPDDLTYTLRCKNNRDLAGIDTDHLDASDELIIRIDTLEQKLDLLIEKLSKQAP